VHLQTCATASATTKWPQATNNQPQICGEQRKQHTHKNALEECFFYVHMHASTYIDVYMYSKKMAMRVPANWAESLSQGHKANAGFQSRQQMLVLLN